MAQEINEILSQMSAEDLERRKKIAQKLWDEHFSSHQQKKEFIRNFAAELRSARKGALAAGNDDITALNEERLVAFLLIFTKCKLDIYRDQIGDVLIEGLKYQQKDIKRYCFEYANKHIGAGFVDMGWWKKLLGKQYVSKYAWKLLRLHADKIPSYARAVLTADIIFWAQDATTQKKWQELDEELGTHYDFVKEFSIPMS